MTTEKAREIRSGSDDPEAVSHADGFIAGFEAGRESCENNHVIKTANPQLPAEIDRLKDLLTEREKEIREIREIHARLLNKFLVNCRELAALKSQSLKRESEVRGLVEAAKKAAECCNFDCQGDCLSALEAALAPFTATEATK